MTTKSDPRSRAARLAQALVDASIDASERALAEQLLARIRLPMSKVLEKVPGHSVTDRARCVGVTRATYYSWFDGFSRPKRKQAERLEQLTGFPANLIHGDPGWEVEK